MTIKDDFRECSLTGSPIFFNSSTVDQVHNDLDKQDNVKTNLEFIKLHV